MESSFKKDQIIENKFNFEAERKIDPETYNQIENLIQQQVN